MTDLEIQSWHLYELDLDKVPSQDATEILAEMTKRPPKSVFRTGEKCLQK